MSRLLPVAAANQQRSGVRKKAPPRAEIAELFYNEDAHGASLLIAALHLFTLEELQDYHPHTLRLELQDELKMSDIDDDVMSRLYAAITILTTDLFYQNVQSFIEICNVLAGNPPLPGFFDPADTFEMAVAMAQANIIDPLDGSRDMDFSEEVRGYMGAQLAEEGFFSPPGILREAVIPSVSQTTEITDNAELIEASLTADQERHADVETAVTLMLDEIREQVAPILSQADDGNVASRSIENAAGLSLG